MAHLSAPCGRAALIASIFALAPRVAGAQSTEATTPHAAEATAEAAEREAGERAEAGEHEREPWFHLGFAGTFLVGLGNGTPVARYGPGAVFGFTLVPGVLELNPFVRVLSSEEGLIVPIDLQFEVPFNVARWFHPFVALGPTIAPTFSAEGVRVPFGGAASVGAHFYVAREYALLVEANYNLLYNDGSLEHEIGGTVGALVGF